MRKLTKEQLRLAAAVLGSKGGHATARALTSDQRRANALHALRTRWDRRQAHKLLETHLESVTGKGDRALKQILTDPMTGRNDTWVLKCSNDPATPGIENIESGYGLVSNTGIARCD